MLNTEEFGGQLVGRGFNFYAGVPCSYLANLINYANNNCEYIAAANEGDAVAIAAGAALGGKHSVVLMQNSGLTNAASPLTSLNYIFNIPVLGFVSLRGETGFPDEPQHALMGRITTGMLDLMEIDWEYLSNEMAEAKQQLARAFASIESNRTFFFVVKRDTFGKVTLKNMPRRDVPTRSSVNWSRDDQRPRRIDVLRTIAGFRDANTALLATTGFTGRELFTLGDADTNFYMVGSMGCIGPFGLGLAMTQRDKDIIAIDGDGSLLMRMGSLAVNAYYHPDNLMHLVLDNNAYESTGGQATVSQDIDFVALASAAGYPSACYVHDLDDLAAAIRKWKAARGLTFVYMKIACGTQKDLPRPAIGPQAVKQRFAKAFHG